MLNGELCNGELAAEEQKSGFYLSRVKRGDEKGEHNG